MKATTVSRSNAGTELQSLRHNRMYLAIMVLLLVCACSWVLVSVMATKDTSEVSVQAAQFTTPINPNLDIDVFTIAENKRYFTESELELFPIYRLIKDAGDTYRVIPIDTPKAEIEKLTTAQQSPVATPRPPTATPAAPASVSGTTGE